jgi:hypothetical protein
LFTRPNVRGEKNSRHIRPVIAIVAKKEAEELLVGIAERSEEINEILRRHTSWIFGCAGSI